MFDQPGRTGFHAWPAPASPAPGTRRRNRGRHHTHIMASQQLFLGFDLGGTKMLAVLMDADLKVITTAKQPTLGTQGADEGLERMLDLAAKVVSQADAKPADITAIGVGCPGLVNPSKGILLHAPNLGWRDVPVRDAFRKSFKADVAVLNDVDAGTYGEFALGAGRGARSLLGVFPGTGVGSGFVYDGNLVMGRNVSAMELGNIYLPTAGLASKRRGAVILEDLCSRLAIASSAAVEAYRGRSPTLMEGDSLDLRNLKSKAIAKAAAADKAIERVIKNAVHHLGLGVAAAVNLLAPDRLVIGGGLAEEMPQYFVTKLRKKIKAFAMPPLFKDLEITTATLGDNAVAVGAAAWQQHLARHQS